MSKCRCHLLIAFFCHIRHFVSLAARFFTDLKRHSCSTVGSAVYLIYTAWRSASRNPCNEVSAHDEFQGLKYSCLEMVSNYGGQVSQKYIVQIYPCM